MQPIRQIIEDAPHSVQIPVELRHRRIELIIWPLDTGEVVAAQPDHEPAKADAILIPGQDGGAARNRPRFNIAAVDRIEIPSREERNARR